MTHLKTVLSFFSALVALGAVACARGKAGREHDETAIGRKIETLVDAIRAMDVERVMPVYAPDLVSFDIEPPLRHLRPEAKRKNWTGVFSTYQPPLAYELRDLSLTVGDDVAFGRSLVRISGTLKNGAKSGYWLRWTMCWRKIDGDWLIVHDQVSVPLDFESGKALLNLEP